MRNVFKLISFILIFLITFENICFADDEIEEVDEDIDSVWASYSDDVTSTPNTYSKHIICIERTTESVLFEKDAYSKCAMASTTKILTGIIIIENCNLSAEVEISKKAANTGGSTLGITEGQKITVESLLYGLLLRSGNDTAVALAEYMSGSVEEFSNVMNEKAKDIGLKNSNFVTPHGLDNDNHYTTAYDLAILTNYALKNETFLKFVGTKQINVNVGGNQRILNNTNELLGVVKGVYGVKTGFTGNAGRCLVTACKRDNLDVIIVVLGADTKNIRGKDTKAVIEYVFNNFKMIDTENEIKDLFNNFKNNEEIKALKSLNKVFINYEKSENYIYPINKNYITKLKSSIYCLNRIEAPVKEKCIIGKMRLICDDKILYEIDVYLDKKIERINFKEYLKIFVENYISFYSI